MNSDLKNARETLLSGGYTYVLQKGETQVCGNERGVRPLLGLLESGESFSGYSAADKVVGRAAAMLYCLLKVKEVWALVMSKGAEEIFEKYQVGYVCENTVEYIINRAGTGKCPMEAASESVTDIKEAPQVFSQTLEKMRNGG